MNTFTLTFASCLTLGSLQNPLKMNLQNRRPKGVQDDIQGSQNHCKLMKNPAQGPPDPIFDVILSIFVFERQYNEFNGFSGSWGTLKENKSTRIASDNHIETMYRQNTIQSTFCIKKWCRLPSKIGSQITLNRAWDRHEIALGHLSRHCVILTPRTTDKVLQKRPQECKSEAKKHPKWSTMSLQPSKHWFVECQGPAAGAKPSNIYIYIYTYIYKIPGGGATRPDLCIYCIYLYMLRYM